MRAMELKVWVDGVQRIVCGVTEHTTCQEVVIALAQAIGRTGRYTLIERWRETERHLAPHENPVVSLNMWGQYASDVQLVLQRTGPSLSECPNSDGASRVPERGLYRQSLPPLAKLRPSANDRSLKRREPKRKSLTFTAKGLRDIFGKGRDAEAKQQQRALNQGRGVVSVPLSPARGLVRLVQLQKDKLQLLERRLQGSEAELHRCETGDVGMCIEGQEGIGVLEEELVRLEQQLRRNEVEMSEEEFWQNELQIEQESERQLREQLQELIVRVRECEARLGEYLTRIQGMEAGLEQETEQSRQVDEEEAWAQLGKVRAELEQQVQHRVQLESSCRAVDRSLGQSSKKLQEKEQELEQLTRELRQVNLQQFIHQTGTKVSVLPAQPNDQNNTDLQPGSLKRLGSSRLLPGDLRALQSPVSSGFNPEGIYV
ncbi:ras association domain-containing protein 8 [Oncorhynchus keta]|uniref:ras association domain-containing protein 8 n=1 Tax=Oncorhynchus keta TaxID=8018 RepID=UPI0015FA521F|nr:ras association domain-containing protein 8 [Oncorhynchus keta]XP_052316587.1 ras association domain-containing protein 8 [Oncorhynchus keta]XP_052316588.1 ras association domain-containing protein 8 [Oncorhynchus keta]XP_052316589.1 ras association domain-containing protein 8 [Oncorhynchus keta]XP_052316590.1 ras association domain-containing protein 8 [Oncorhynchus keta]XP_052316591.1 ras association domain-containing protein 8 [Oncorhynchus keta]XP_052316592.1 ras association domain-con